MHPSPAFRAPSEARVLAFVRDRAFGMLTVAGSDGPLIAHVPVLLSPEGDSLDLHLVRSNSIARLSEGAPVVAVAGPDAYVSPTGTRCPTSCRLGTMSPSTCAAR